MNKDYRPDIWQLQAKLDTQGLVAALKSDDPGIRKRAAAALRALGAVDSIPALRVALANEQDADVRNHLSAALEALQLEAKRTTDTQEAIVPETPVGKLIAQLRSKDPDDVIKAANGLGELGDKLAVEPLVVLFNDAKVSIQVRLAVAEALLKLEAAPVEVTLLAALRHADWHIRRNGAAILGQLRAEWAVEPLVKALNDPNRIVQKTARAALKHIGTPDALRALGVAEAQFNLPKTDDLKPIVTPPSEKPAVPKGLLKRFQEKIGGETPSTPAETTAPADNKAQTEPSTAENKVGDDLVWPKRENPPTIHFRPTEPLNPNYASGDFPDARKSITLGMSAEDKDDPTETKPDEDAKTEQPPTDNKLAWPKRPDAIHINPTAPLNPKALKDVEKSLNPPPSEDDDTKDSPAP